MTANRDMVEEISERRSLPEAPRSSGIRNGSLLGTSLLRITGILRAAAFEAVRLRVFPEC
jgi:hypothetical protein